MILFDWGTEMKKLTRSVGAIFEYEGIFLKVVQKDYIGCGNCHFNTNNKICERKNSITGFCSGQARTDDTYVIFKKVK